MRTLPPPRPTYGTWTRCQSPHVDAHAAAAQAHLWYMDKVSEAAACAECRKAMLIAAKSS